MLADELSTTEVEKMTGKRRPASQATVLARQGIPFRFTPRRVIVDRAIALAHDLLPAASSAAGVDLSKVR